MTGATADGPSFPRGPAPGQASQSLLVNPHGDYIRYHELGHAQKHSRYRGEKEAHVNFLMVYVEVVKYGYDLDEAFRRSFNPRGGNFSVDAAAINWMVTDNFRNGNEMDHSNTIFDEFRYQQRGYAKYADMARLYGWELLSGFHRQENLDIAMETASSCTIADLGITDDRTYRFSLQAGEDLTPLIRECSKLFVSSFCLIYMD